MTCLYPGCTRTPDVAQVCAPCRVRMRDQLRDVVEFYAIARAIGVDPVEWFSRIVKDFPATVDV